jgi:hypothetical protein
MKDVVYSDRAKEDSQGFAALQAMTEILEQVLGPASGQVKAEWDKSTDARGRPVYVLRLSDWTGAASAVFAPDDLNPTNLLWARLYRLWGQLLQIRNHRQLEELASMAGEES